MTGRRRMDPPGQDVVCGGSVTPRVGATGHLARSRRSRAPSGAGSGHLTAHDAVPQALGPHVPEARTLVQRPRAVVEHRHLAPVAGVVRIALDDATAGLTDEVDGTT